MNVRMKKRILLPTICLATLVFMFSCSSELPDYPGQKEEPAEKMLTLTVTAGTVEDSIMTKAVVEEADGPKSPWKWEAGDKLQLVSIVSGDTTITPLTVSRISADSTRAEFKGSVGAGRVTAGTTYRFFYMGERTITQDDVRAGRISVDLSSQTGKIQDLKKYCVLSGTGKLAISGLNASIENDVKLENAFAVAHFAMRANDNTLLTKVGIRGAGVYAEAGVSFDDGKAVGVTEAGTEADPETNVFIAGGATDFYVTLVPGSVTPSFDGYYANSYNADVVTTAPVTRDYDEEKSFVYYGGSKAVFSVSETQTVAITNGNMQYVMPIQTYTSNMNTNTLKANTLIRWKKSVPLKIAGALTTHPGYYRLAPEQWRLAIPTSVKGGNYTFATVMKDGKRYISPEAYRYFDVPSWGTIDNPTLLNYTSVLSGSGVDTQYDFGNKLLVGTKPTRTMTSDEWGYLLYKDASNNTKRYWQVGSKKVERWARCFIDDIRDGNKKGKWQNTEQRGYLIFPDNMSIEDAKKAFETTSPIFGRWAVSSKNPTTHELIKKSGAVFIPLTAWRPTGSNVLQQVGNHGNYFTSSYRGGGIIHVLMTDGGFPNTANASDAGQGCMTRLVQNIN